MVRGRIAGEVGPDLDPVHVRDDQQRRVAEVPTILEKLVVSLVEIGPFLLVLPAEEPLLAEVGEPVLPPSFMTRRSVVNVYPLGSTAPGLGCFRLRKGQGSALARRNARNVGTSAICRRTQRRPFVY